VYRHGRAATGTIGVGSEGTDMDGTEAAALGRADGAEWWDGKTIRHMF